MDERRIYSFEELASMEPSRANEIMKRIQEEAAQAAYAYEDTSRRFSDQLREKDSEIAMLKEENKLLAEQIEVLKAALGDKKAVIRVRNNENYGRKTERLQAWLSGMLSGMSDQDKANVMDRLSEMLPGLSVEAPSAEEGSGDEAGNGHEEAAQPEQKNSGAAQEETPQELDGNGGAAEPENGKRGNPNLRRTPGFISRYFKDGTPVVFTIDDFTYTAEEVKARFGLENIDDLVYLCSDIKIYETANVIPATAYHTFHISLKLKRNSDGSTRTLWNQPHGKLFDGASICSPSLLSYIIIQKFVNGTTYYRIEPMLTGMGLNLKRPTFIGWVEKAARMLAALPRHMMRQLKKCKVIQTDETFDTISHDERGAGKASYYWMFRPSEYASGSMPVIVYWFEQSRSAVIPEYYLYDYTGKVMSDGYIAYRTLASRNGDIIRCVCWIHGRRFLIKSFIGSDFEFNARMTGENGPKSLQNLDICHLDEVDEEQKVSLWGWICLLIIAEMFRIEKELKDLTPEDRLAGRIREMKPLADQLFELVRLVKGHPQVLANSYAKEAVSYFDKNQEALQRIFEDGLVPLSNNASERAAISLALGRNSWKAHDTVEGARTTALFYTLVETAKANGANPYLYIQFLLESIRDIWHLHEAELLESERFEENKRRRLDAALAKLKKHPGTDPELDMTGLGEEPDLSFLECLMPWSEEFRGYCQCQETRAAKMIADALTREGLGKKPVSDGAFHRILGAGSRNAREEFVRKGLKGAVDDMEPASVPGAGEEPPAMGNPVKDAVLPGKRKPFCFSAGKAELSPPGQPAAEQPGWDIPARTQPVPAAVAEEAGSQEADYDGMMSRENCGGMCPHNRENDPEADSRAERLAAPSPGHASSAPADGRDAPIPGKRAMAWHFHIPVLSGPSLRQRLCTQRPGRRRNGRRLKKQDFRKRIPGWKADCCSTCCPGAKKDI